MSRRDINIIWKLLLISSALGILIWLGCDNAPVQPRYDDESQTYVIRKKSGNLEQTIHLSDVTPSPGDTLLIESVVVNHGAAQIIESRICGLNIRSDLRMKHAGPACRGYSSRRMVDTGEEVVSWEAGVITSGAGRYQLRIQHLLDPEVYVDVTVRVMGR